MATDGKIEIKIKERTVQRRLFTKAANSLETLLKNVPQRSEECELRTAWRKLVELKELLFRQDEIIKNHILTESTLDEEKLENEYEDQLKYKTRWLSVDILYELEIKKFTDHYHYKPEPSKLRLPKLDIIKFDGNLKNWIPFWGQFKKIHEDKTIDPENKFQYLLQAITPGTDVRLLVESYPVSAENYNKCIEHIISRYAREELLTQLYVRELLSLILNKTESESLTTLFDKLSAHLRALETLGVTKNHATFLLPIIESALPQEVLKAWERSTTHSNKMDEELAQLLAFLQREVESEQRIKMAENSFTSTQLSSTPPPATASCLTTMKKEHKVTCVWCEKENHTSLECYKIHNISLDQKHEILKKKKACKNCFKTNHHTKACKAFTKCLICQKRHNTILCPTQVETKSTSATTSLSPEGTTLLQTAEVEILHDGKKMSVRALFDSGSQRTYVKQEVVDKLGILPTKKEALTHCLFGGVQTKSTEYNLYKLKIKSISDDFETNINALGQNYICGNIPKINSKDKMLGNLLKKHNIKLTDKGDSNDIGLLIGADFSGFLFAGTHIQLENGLTAVKTYFGWTLQGKVRNSVNNLSTTLFCSNISNDLTGYWALETLGIQDPAEVKSKSEIAAEVWTSFEESIKVDTEGRYEVKLPFKVGHDDLLPNYEIAKQRLISMTKKLTSTGKFQQYHAVFQNWCDLGIIEKVPPSEVKHDTGHYLPHRGVVRESSLTSTLRPVYDASAKDKNGLSLNACLEKGINLIDLIPNLLVGFRKGAIGITSDIEKAFLQISLPLDDRNYLKFLWWDDESLKEMVVFRHCRVVFGLTSSPFLLSATLNHHLGKVSGEYEETAKLLKRSFYVDNCLTSLDTENETQKFIDESKNIMEAAQFNLRMWVTSPLPINETGKQVISVLGLNWDTSTDELYCNSRSMPDPENIQKLTKRDLLSLTQRVFDPIGYTVPAMLTPKIILQETWRRELSWDTELPPDLLNKFKDWYKYITYLDECRVPRKLTANILNKCKVSVHLFCDASKHGYGACVLLRTEKDSQVTVQLISAKSRVAPPQKITIPRLELTAALIGARLLTHARENLNLPNCPEYCWTDSGVTLCWIKRELTLNTFVGNRIKEIRQHTDTKNWHHIPGEQNWADLASRGCNARDLVECRWWEGPRWLRQPLEEWPRSELVVDEDEIHLETRKTVCNKHVCSNESLLDRLQCYFSKYTKIIRMTAWILRFMHNTRKTNNRRKGEITYPEYEKAEKVIIKLIQQEHNEFLQKRSTNLTQFYDKDGLIRIKTKLLLSLDFSEYVKTPYLLPAKAVVLKMVSQRHTQLQHAGTNQLIADIRARFWIIGIRRLVKSVISSCVICMRYRSKSVKAPTAPLPMERITCSAPFQTTGVDLGGPLYLKSGEKCWIVLYTCAVYRAVHLELTRSLSTEAFMMTLRRFIARRGRVDMLSSDQGTNFQGTKNLLSSLNWEEVQRQSTVRRIVWKMNAPSAAWWGGYWERLIRILKDLLKRVLGKASVSYDELETILCDCEATMNGRPLTYVCSDTGDNLEPLTPAYFIQPIYNTDVDDLDNIDTKSLNSRLQYLQKLREQFRHRFKTEYLTLLVQKGREQKDSLKIGDIVLIETEEKRLKWPLGIIEDMFAGKDGVERTARVKTSIGQKIRPVQRLYKLELYTDRNIFNEVPEPVTAENTKDTAQPVAPTVFTSDAPQQSTRSGRNIKLPSKFNLYYV